MARLLAMTGCRRGEALGLRWDDLDLEANTITIRRALVPLGGRVEVSEPKTARGRRRIALDPLTIEALKDHAARQADEQTRCQSWNETGYIFTTEEGQPLDPHRTSKAFERHLRAAALDVLATEPPGPDHRLLRRPDVLVTPHMGPHTAEATAAMGARALDDLLAVLSGRAPRYPV